MLLFQLGQVTFWWHFQLEYLQPSSCREVMGIRISCGKFQCKDFMQSQLVAKEGRGFEYHRWKIIIMQGFFVKSSWQGVKEVLIS